MQLTNKNYFSKEANLHYMSVSQYKDFLKCPVGALAKINGLWENDKSDALLIGSYIDAYFSGELKEFRLEHPELFTKIGSLYAKYEICNQIIKVIEADEFMLSFYKGQAQVIETGFIHGVPFKVKYDALYDDKIVDGKVMKNFKDIWSKTAKSYVEFWEAWQYDLQLAIYQEIHYQNCNIKKDTYLSAVSKESITDKVLLKFKQETLDKAFETYISYDKVNNFNEMKKGNIDPIGCGECDYCKSIKKLSVFDVREV